MRFLCLAYGDARDWHGLSETEQQSLLAQDDVLRQRGDIVVAVQGPVTTLRAWDGKAHTTTDVFAHAEVPLAGCGIVEAENLEEAIRLLKDTPCARAKGAIELHRILAINLRE